MYLNIDQINKATLNASKTKARTKKQEEKNESNIQSRKK